MHRLRATVIGAWLALLAPSSAAGAALAVESLNYPAWLLRNYQTQPLAAGAQLQPNDLVRSGAGGRVRIVLDSGAVIDLGEASRLVIESGAAAASSSPAAALQLLRGLFRIDAAPRAEGADTVLEIRVGALKVSTGDAEFWGRSDARQDLACLLRGQLQLRDGAGSTKLERAQSCYLKPRQRAALPVDTVALEQHRLWVAETGPDTAAGIAAVGGQWQLVLASFEDLGAAERELARLRELGYAARRKSVLRRGRSLHRLLLPGFVSIEAALGARARIERDLGIADAWVWRTD